MDLYFGDILLGTISYNPKRTAWYFTLGKSEPHLIYDGDQDEVDCREVLGIALYVFFHEKPSEMSLPTPPQDWIDTQLQILLGAVKAGTHIVEPKQKGN